LDITWHGHSCFRLRGREVAIVTDPYGRGTRYPPLRLTADVVTVSHPHPHHDFVDAVQRGGDRPRRVDGPGEYEIGGVMISGVATYRDKQKGKQHGKNTAYLFGLDDLRICHLGDLGHTLSAEQIEALKDADVLLIPVGGHCTIDAVEAVEVVSQLEPKLVIPMHYGTPGVPSDPVERFCRELGVADLSPMPRLSVTRGSLPDETQVVLMAAPEPRR
jgi:L-ascorbate metabolism protein UlaG (beta-lactamase superfamily)